MKLQKILALMRKAITQYNMIKANDEIAVGVSGGKDSMVLLCALAAYRRFSPEPFNLKAITIDLGLNMDLTPIKDYCRGIDVEYTVVKTDIYDIIFNIRKDPNPCSLCSKMRRGALNTALKQQGCNKLALAHHADDLVETFLLSMIYEGRLSTFAPLSYMDRADVTMIRPFVFLKETDIAAYSKNLPVVHNPCPVNHHTQREYMKNLLKNINDDIPIAFDRIHSAITHPERNNLFKPN